MKVSRVVIIASVFTVVVTLYSLSELQRITDDASKSEQNTQQHVELHGAHADWRTIAERAVQHVERLPLHAGSLFHRSAITDGMSHPLTQHTQSIDKMAQTKAQLEKNQMIAALKKVDDSHPTSSVSKNHAGSTSSVSRSTESSTSLSPKGDTCHTMPNTELWGDVVVSGSMLKKASAGECCEACKAVKPASDDDMSCNVWVWCGDKKLCGTQYQECWLKHLVRPEAVKPAREGPAVGWTSGMVGDLPVVDVSQRTGPPQMFHTVTTAQGTAVHWQSRVHYYWFKKVKAQCQKGPRCEMGGFTRLLHSGKADDLMDEIPTYVVDPLPHDKVDHSWYVVLNRPYAFVQWVQKATIPEKYVLMAEPDHIFLRPMPNFMRGDKPAAFPFFYIEPYTRENAPITQKFTGKIPRSELEKIAPIGNSPTYMTFDDMKRVMPLWMNLSIEIFKDPDSNKKWGWVQEMYAFTIALYNAGIKTIDLYLDLMAQPPWDDAYRIHGKPFHILHYTYPMDYDLNGKFTPGKVGEWQFNKRQYSGRPIGRHIPDPPKGLQNELVRHLLGAINEATANIPCWDQYEKSGVAVYDCGEKAGNATLVEMNL